MSTHNIHFHDKIRKKVPKLSQNICFLELLEEFPVYSKTVNEPLVFKLFNMSKCASYSRAFCHESLLLWALVIRYRDPGQTIHYRFAHLNATLYLITPLVAVYIGYNGQQKTKRNTRGVRKYFQMTCIQDTHGIYLYKTNTKGMTDNYCTLCINIFEIYKTVLWQFRLLSGVVLETALKRVRKRIENVAEIRYYIKAHCKLGLNVKSICDEMCCLWG